MIFRVFPSRLNLNHSVRAILDDICIRMPEFAHVDPSRILVVAGEARRASRGTIKPLAFRKEQTTDRQGRTKPLIRVEGQRMLYCITLRPLFFRKSTATQRVETLLHELFHISTRFDGTLDARHRHERMGARFGRRLRPLVRRYLSGCAEALVAPFGWDGEADIWQWLERPSAYLPLGKCRRLYTEKQLFLATVRMVQVAPNSLLTKAPLAGFVKS